MKSNLTESMRSINIAKVLNLLRRSGRLLSRPEIAAEVGLSKVTVSNIINHLSKKIPFVRKAGVGIPDQRGGRRPLLIELDPNSKRVVGARLGVDLVEVVLSDITGRELKKLQGTPDSGSRIEFLANMIDELLSSTKTKREMILGLVTTFDSWEPTPNNSNPKSPSWEKLLEKRLNLEIMAVQLPQALAFGEAWYNQGAQSKFFLVTLDPKLGFVSVRNGVLEENPGDFGACYFHPRPYHTTKLTEEAHLKDRSVGNQNLSISQALSPTVLENNASTSYGHPVNSQELSHLATTGDQPAREIFQEYGHNLGCALSLVVHMFRLKKILIGGLLARDWMHFEGSLKQALAFHLAASNQGQVVVRPVHPEQLGGLKGTIAMALNRWVYRVELLEQTQPQEISSIEEEAWAPLTAIDEGLEVWA